MRFLLIWYNNSHSNLRKFKNKSLLWFTQPVVPKGRVKERFTSIIIPLEQWESRNEESLLLYQALLPRALPTQSELCRKSKMCSNRAPWDENLNKQGSEAECSPFKGPSASRYGKPVSTHNCEHYKLAKALATDKKGESEGQKSIQTFPGNNKDQTAHD